MPFSEEQLKGVVTQERLRAALDARDPGLIIGENHSNPYARGLIGNLINAGAVQHLCIESPDVSQAMAFQGNPGDVAAESTLCLGHWLRERAAEKTDLSANEDWLRFKENWNQIALFIYDKGNCASTVNLIEFAVRNGVEVHFIDSNFVEISGPKIPRPTMKSRNQHMLAYLGRLKERHGSLARCVALVGNDHITGNFDNFFSSLQMRKLSATRQGNEAS